MASVPSCPLASSLGHGAAHDQRAGSVGPPGFSLPFYRLLGPVPVQSAFFAGMRGWVSFMNLGTSGVGGGITVATDSHFRCLDGQSEETFTTNLGPP